MFFYYWKADQKYFIINYKFHVLLTTGVKAKTNPEPELFSGGGSGRGGGAGCTCKLCNDCGNFNIWKDTMAKLLLSLFKLIFLTWIYGWPEEWKLYHTLGKLWAISPLINTRGMTIHLAHEMRQNTDTWFTRTRQYFNTIFKKF